MNFEVLTCFRSADAVTLFLRKLKALITSLDFFKKCITQNAANIFLRNAKINYRGVLNNKGGTQILTQNQYQGGSSY